MDVLTKAVSILFYYLIDYWTVIEDPRTRDFPFVSGGIWKILVVVFGYFTLTRYLLPIHMKDKPAYDVRTTMFIHNIVMVTSNAYLFIEGVSSCQSGRVFLDFKYPGKIDRSHSTMHYLWIEWLFMII